MHLATDNPPRKLSECAENFFGDTYDHISEVLLSFFKNLTFFLFNKKIHKEFWLEPGFQTSEAHKSGWKYQKLKRTKVPLENAFRHVW